RQLQSFPTRRSSDLDNFFRLGGDSILSIQVITQARQAGIQITPRQMFERQTIAELAEVATVLQETAAEAEETSASGPVPLLPIQDRKSTRLNSSHQI